MQNIVRQLITEVSCEYKEGRLYDETIKTFGIGDKRKIVVTEQNGMHHRVNVRAYIYDPHEETWYDQDGEECSKHEEWRWVFDEDTACHDYRVDHAIAKAYGVLMCAMV